MRVLNYIKTNDFKISISAAQFRESVVGSALARKYNFLFQPSPHSAQQDYAKSCDYGLIDPIHSRAYRVEQQDCFHLESLDGKFAFELNTHDDDGSVRPGKLRYCDADKFVYNAPKLETLFIFDWIPIKELILDLYDQDQVDLISYDRTNWNHDSCPIDLILVNASILLAEKSVKYFSYKELNLPNIFFKTYDKPKQN